MTTDSKNTESVVLTDYLDNLSLWLESHGPDEVPGIDSAVLIHEIPTGAAAEIRRLEGLQDPEALTAAHMLGFEAGKDAMKARVEQLETALREIQYGPTYMGTGEVDQYMDTQFVRRILKAALNPESETG